jgi:hypothetical protein
VDRHVEVWVYHRVTGDLSKSPKEQRMSLASIGLHLKQNIERLAGTLGIVADTVCEWVVGSLDALISHVLRYVPRFMRSIEYASKSLARWRNLRRTKDLIIHRKALRFVNSKYRSGCLVDVNGVFE